MSEYQLYEFLALDRPLSAEDLAYVRTLSSRVQPTPTQATFTYSYSSFPGDPLKLPAVHFGFGHGNGAHAPDEYYLIESTNPKVQGFDAAVKSYVDYLHELAHQ